MRIISQSGNNSIVFENAILERRGNTLLALISPDINIVLGRYNSDAEAAKVFADIHSLYDEQFEWPFNPEEWIEVYRMPQAGEYGI